MYRFKLFKEYQAGYAKAHYNQSTESQIQRANIAEVVKKKKKKNSILHLRNNTSING